MSTNSYIGIQNEDGSVQCIYCHWDGYPSHNGRILNEHYQEEEKVRKLISLGDLSILAENVDPDESKVHNWSNPQDDVCLFYGRDRGEKNVGFKTVAGEQGFLNKAKNAVASYAYLFDGDWVMFKL